MRVDRHCQRIFARLVFGKFVITYRGGISAIQERNGREQVTGVSYFDPDDVRAVGVFDDYIINGFIGPGSAAMRIDDLYFKAEGMVRLILAKMLDGWKQS